MYLPTKHKLAVDTWESLKRFIAIPGIFLYCIMSSYSISNIDSNHFTGYNNRSPSEEFDLDDLMSNINSQSPPDSNDDMLTIPTKDMNMQGGRYNSSNENVVLGPDDHNDSDLMYHETVLNDLVIAANKKIYDHIFRMKVKLEMDKRDALTDMQSKYEDVIAQDKAKISKLEDQVRKLEETNMHQLDEFYKEKKADAQLLERSLKLQELKLSFLKWQYNADAEKLEKDLTELSVQLAEQNEKNKIYIKKLSDNHQQELEEMKSSMTIKMDNATKTVSYSLRTELMKHDS